MCLSIFPLLFPIFHLVFNQSPLGNLHYELRDSSSQHKTFTTLAIPKFPTLCLLLTYHVQVFSKYLNLPYYMFLSLQFCSSYFFSTVTGHHIFAKWDTTILPRRSSNCMSVMDGVILIVPQPKLTSYSFLAPFHLFGPMVDVADAIMWHSPQPSFGLPFCARKLENWKTEKPLIPDYFSARVST